MASGILAGRIALVTGGGSGIGRAVCQVFAREGAKVAIVDLNRKSAAETLDTITGDHYIFTADISSLEAVNNLMFEVRDKYERPPCIVVNSAGITKDAFFLKMDEQSYDEVMNVNLKGTFLVTQAVCRMLVKERMPGSIVNISSISGKSGNVGQANYAATKAGVIGLTKTIAKELARNGIRCNAVMPGFIETPMTQAMPDKVLEQFLKMVPLGRKGKAEEIAETCAFLASERSSYITGATIDVTGGLLL